MNLAIRVHSSKTLNWRRRRRCLQRCSRGSHLRHGFRKLLQKSLAEAGEHTAILINGLDADGIGNNGPDNEACKQEKQRGHPYPAPVHSEPRQYKSIRHANRRQYPGQCNSGTTTLGMKSAERDADADAFADHQGHDRINQQPSQNKQKQRRMVLVESLFHRLSVGRHPAFDA